MRQHMQRAWNVEKTLYLLGFISGPATEEYEDPEDD